MFDPKDLELLKNIVQHDLLRFIGETLAMTFLPTVIAFLIGLPLGSCWWSARRMGSCRCRRP